MDIHSLKYGWQWAWGRWYCAMRGVQFGPDLRVYGLPVISRHKSGRIQLGNHVVLNSNPTLNLAGIFGRATLVAAAPESEIVIGDHSGMSGGVIFAAKSVRIGHYVDLGVNTLVYDTDFHPLDWQLRRNKVNPSNVASAPVVIEDDAWVGANCVILKGVHIGQRAIIAAGSVVNRNIPEDTVWGGNPIKFIKYL